MNNDIRAEIEKYFRDVIEPAVGEALGKAMAEMDASVAAKPKAVATELTFKGHWHEGTQYERGNFCSLGGIWHANKATTSRPGTDDTWTLAIARGRDGKDAAPPEAPERRTAM